MASPKSERPTEKLVTLYETNVADVVAMARRFADDLEAGEHGKPRSVVVVVEGEHGEPMVFGWGEADALRCIGLLHLGLVNMSCR